MQSYSGAAKFLPELALECLASDITRKRIDYHHMADFLKSRGHAAIRPLDEFGHLDCTIFSRDHRRYGHFTPLRILNAENGYLDDSRMPNDDLFDIFGVNVDAA